MYHKMSKLEIVVGADGRTAVPRLLTQIRDCYGGRTKDCRVLTHIVPRVVSKSDSDHGSGYHGHRTRGLTPAGTICHSIRSLGHYPIQRNEFKKEIVTTSRLCNLMKL